MLGAHRDERHGSNDHVAVDGRFSLGRDAAMVLLLYEAFLPVAEPLLGNRMDEVVVEVSNSSPRVFPYENQPGEIR